MANALLFYRTPTTRQVDVSPTDYSNPFNLPTGQKLEFDFPTNILEGLNLNYKNNIKKIPPPNQDGSRIVNVQENGALDETLVIRGIFKKNIGDGVTRLNAMKKVKQVDTYHLYGIFGIKIDNASAFNFDPNSSQGMFIESMQVGYAGQSPTRYAFTLNLGFGGLLP